MSVVFKCNQITKNFGVTQALKGVDLTIETGKIYGLIGENGSGKSTLASIIAGIQKATSGNITYFDKVWEPENSLYAKKNGVSIVVQENGTIPYATVAHNIFIGQEKNFLSLGL